MACTREGNGVFFCQETVDFFADRLTPLLGSEIGESIRADPLQLELVLVGIFGIAVVINLILFGPADRYQRWRWWRHD